LFAKESHGTATDADRERLQQLQIMLDQCWDLLRQREALGRDVGLAESGFQPWVLAMQKCALKVAR